MVRAQIHNYFYIPNYDSSGITWGEAAAGLSAWVAMAVRRPSRVRASMATRSSESAAGAPTTNPRFFDMA